jgi:hypothetical protein
VTEEREIAAFGSSHVKDHIKWKNRIFQLKNKSENDILNYKDPLERQRHRPNLKVPNKIALIDTKTTEASKPSSPCAKRGRKNSARLGQNTLETSVSYVPEILQTLSIDDNEIEFTERIVYKFPHLGKKVFTKFALEGAYQDWTNTFKRSTVHWDKSLEILNPDK